MVAANTASRQQAAREAEVLLQEEQLEFESWRDSLATVPTIKVAPCGSLLPSFLPHAGADAPSSVSAAFLGFLLSAAPIPKSSSAGDSLY